MKMDLEEDEDEVDEWVLFHNVVQFLSTFFPNKRFVCRDEDDEDDEDDDDEEGDEEEDIEESPVKAGLYFTSWLMCI